MKRVLRVPVLLFVAVAAGAPSTPARAADAPARLAVRAAHVIDGRAQAARGPVWVVVSGDTIESVRTSAPAGPEVIDLGDATLLPGFTACRDVGGGGLVDAALRDAAECMGWAGRVGEIRPGAHADRIAVAGDPLRNIRLLESVRWVMKGGKIHKDELSK